jgi:hypothetical protein
MVESPEGEVLYDDVVVLSEVLENPPFQRPFGSFRIPESGVTVYLVGRAIDGSDPSFNLGEIGLKLYGDDSAGTFVIDRLQVGTTKKLEGLRFTYVEERQFSRVGGEQGPQQRAHLDRIRVAHSGFVRGAVLSPPSDVGNGPGR